MKDSLNKRKLAEDIINASIEAGYVDEDWKNAQLVSYNEPDSAFAFFNLDSIADYLDDNVIQELENNKINVENPTAKQLQYLIDKGYLNDEFNMHTAINTPQNIEEILNKVYKTIDVDNFISLLKVSENGNEIKILDQNENILFEGSEDDLVSNSSLKGHEKQRDILQREVIDYKIGDPIVIYVKENNISDSKKEGKKMPANKITITKIKSKAKDSVNLQKLFNDHIEALINEGLFDEDWQNAQIVCFNDPEQALSVFNLNDEEDILGENQLEMLNDLGIDIDNPSKKDLVKLLKTDYFSDEDEDNTDHMLNSQENAKIVFNKHYGENITVDELMACLRLFNEEPDIQMLDQQGNVLVETDYESFEEDFHDEKVIDYKKGNPFIIYVENKSVSDSKKEGKKMPANKIIVTKIKSKTKDSIEDNEILRLAQLLGEAHDKIMEAQDLAKDLVNDEKLADNIEWDLEDLEAEVSEFEFMGEEDPTAALLAKYGPEAEDY